MAWVAKGNKEHRNLNYVYDENLRNVFTHHLIYTFYLSSGKKGWEVGE
jgi:hypothetical protein